MALRLSGTNCWISTSCAKDGDRHVTHLFCQSRLRGLKCPLEGVPGVRPFELGAACFESVPRKVNKKAQRTAHMHRPTEFPGKTPQGCFILSAQ